MNIIEYDDITCIFLTYFLFMLSFIWSVLEPELVNFQLHRFFQDVVDIKDGCFALRHVPSHMLQT